MSFLFRPSLEIQPTTTCCGKEMENTSDKYSEMIEALTDVDTKGALCPFKKTTNEMENTSEKYSEMIETLTDVDTKGDLFTRKTTMDKLVTEKQKVEAIIKKYRARREVLNQLLREEELTE